MTGPPFTPEYRAACRRANLPRRFVEGDYYMRLDEVRYVGRLDAGPAIESIPHCWVPRVDQLIELLNDAGTPMLVVQAGADGIRSVEGNATSGRGNSYEEALLDLLIKTRS